VRGGTQLFVKEVNIGAARYILCRNEAAAQRERSDRQAIVAGITKQLARGDKAQRAPVPFSVSINRPEL
jgi:hypothetical protein